MSLLCYTILLSSNGTRAVSPVAIAILVLITLRDCVAPFGTALEVDVVNVGTSVDNIDINTLTTVGSI